MVKALTVTVYLSRAPSPVRTSDVVLAGTISVAVGGSEMTATLWLYWTSYSVRIPLRSMAGKVSQLTLILLELIVVAVMLRGKPDGTVVIDTHKICSILYQAHHLVLLLY